MIHTAPVPHPNLHLSRLGSRVYPAVIEPLVIYEKLPGHHVLTLSG